jgi:2-dehydropantoate 2-reductase
VGLLARASTREALAVMPLAIVREGGTTTVANLPVAAAPDELPAALQRPALAILCVKGYDTAAALDGLAALAPGLILTLQNGIGNEQQLVARFGAARVASGAITTSVDLESPTRIVVTKAGGIGLAPTGPGADLSLYTAAALAQAGFVVKQYPDYQAMKWSKALLNMLGNATAAILDMSVAEVYADKRLVALERRAFREALAVMERQGWRPINLPRYPAALLALGMRLLPPLLLDPVLRSRVAGGRGGKAPSLLRDLRAGRGRSEGEFLYGAIAAQAAALGLAAPANAGLWRVLGGIARGELAWDDYRGKPDRLLAEIGS